MALAHPEFRPDPGLSREAMEALQRDIAETAVFEDDLGFDPEAVAVDGPVVDEGEYDSSGGPVVVGVDQAFFEERAISALVAVQDGAVVERTHAVTPLEIPYIPGLLAFREGGPILSAFEKLTVEPDLVVFDGSGRIHFRQAGIATQVGVLLDLPSVGVAKNLLCGEPTEPTADRPEGWSTPVVADDSVEAPDGTVIGHAYQSRQWDRSQSINPLIVSPGHRVSAETTLDLVAGFCAGYKLPEPTRLADSHAADVKADSR